LKKKSKAGCLAFLQFTPFLVCYRPVSGPAGLLRNMSHVARPETTSPDLGSPEVQHRGLVLIGGDASTSPGPVT